MKLTMNETLNLYTGLTSLLEINDEGTPFSRYAKRVTMVFLEREVMYWNALSRPERIDAADDKIDLDLPKLHVADLPQFVPDWAYQSLAPILEGEIPKPKPSQLEQIIKKKKRAK